jgi:anti-sigma B factor antagonist
LTSWCGLPGVAETGLTFTAREVAGRCVVRVAGEIDLASSPSLDVCLRGLDGVVIVDLADVTFIDSSGLGVLIRHWKRLRSRSLDLRVRAPQDNVRRVFEVTGLDDLLVDAT